MSACLKVSAHVQYILRVYPSLVSIYEVIEETGASFIYEFAVRNKEYSKRANGEEGSNVLADLPKRLQSTEDMCTKQADFYFHRGLGSSDIMFAFQLYDFGNFFPIHEKQSSWLCFM
jgi:hypothetical protein